MSSDTTSEEEAAEPGSGDHPDIGGPYARYVLFVLMLVYVFNFIDRNILSILAEDIKADQENDSDSKKKVAARRA
ncbi:MAG TPA: hypothetical protein EYN96_11220, partial [Candidatus Hydrogenedentes bacterium]|nr:hypothetical protein [Candidatus Hydrogenedentota bacterium]